MADTYDLIVLGSGPGGYVAAIRAEPARPQDRDRRARESLAESASTGAASRPRRCCVRPRSITISSTPRASACRRGRPGSTSPRWSSAAASVAAQMNRGVTGLMKRNKIGVHMGEGKLTAPGKLSVAAEGKTTELAAKHIIIATGARARDLPVRQGRWQAHLDLSPRDGAQGDADRTAGHRLGRDRDRIRQLLQRPWRQGDGGRDARPHRAGRGCRGQPRTDQVRRPPRGWKS